MKQLKGIFPAALAPFKVKCPPEIGQVIKFNK